METTSGDLSRESILAANDTKIERVHVPEWGGYVHVRTISGTKRDAFEASIVLGDQMNTENIRAKLLVHCLCDRDGGTLFSIDDVVALGDKSAAALTRCYTKASELNAVSNADVDELAKNSGRGATDIS